MMNQLFSVNLKVERNMRNWTRNFLAQQIGSTSKTIARWERGETVPRLQFRQKLCEIFDKSPQDLGLEIKNAEEKKLSVNHPQNRCSISVDSTLQFVPIFGIGIVGPTSFWMIEYRSYINNYFKDYWQRVKTIQAFEYTLHNGAFTMALLYLSPCEPKPDKEKNLNSVCITPKPDIVFIEEAIDKIGKIREQCVKFGKDHIYHYCGSKKPPPIMDTNKDIWCRILPILTNIFQYSTPNCFSPNFTPKFGRFYRPFFTKGLI